MDHDHRGQGASPPVSPNSDDLEVVRQDDPGLQVVPDTGQTPEVRVESDSLPTYVDGPHHIEAGSIEPESKGDYGQRQRDRICGLRPRLFWVLAIGTILLIAGAVGGGVAGALSANHASSSSSSSLSSDATAASASLTTPATLAPTSPLPESATTTTPTATESSSVTGTKTAIYGPSGSVLYRDCPASSDTLYSSDSLPSWEWRKYCDNTTFVSAKPGQQWVNTFAPDLDTCIDMCVQSSIRRESAIAAGEEDPCNAVCWRNGFENDDYPGQCFGFTTANSTTTGGFQFKSDWRCDSAGLINQGVNSATG